MMYAYLVCFAVFTIGLVSSQVSPQNTLCEPGETGIKEIYCWGYVKCFMGRPVTVRCRQGTVLERDSMTCVVHGHTSCNKAVDCTFMRDGLYADREDNCETFYSCNRGQFMGRWYCPADLVFNQRKQTCDYKQKVPQCYSNKSVLNVSSQVSPQYTQCQPGETGIKEIYCWGYVKCFMGRSVTVRCRQGTVLERDSMTCVVHGHTSCNKAVDCTYMRDGLYADREDNCETFYSCNRGQFMGRWYCPADLVFNQRKQICDYKQKVPECYSESVLNVSSQVSPQNTLCQPGETGIKEIYCWGYVKCFMGRPVTVRCRQGTVLERDSMACVVHGHTSCNKAVDCTYMRDGLYADREDNCETFYSCHRGQFMGRWYCPADLVFNQKKQSCDYKQKVPECYRRSLVFETEDNH